MRAKTFTKFGIGLVAASVAACTLAMPAYADPATSKFGTLIGTGSDTTQDVMNGISAAIGGTDGVRIGSFDAIGSATIKTRATGTTMPRPNGSGQGRDVLRVSNGNLNTFTGGGNTWTAANTTNNVDFARSSSGAPADDTTSSGVLTYIPFALDAVTYATSENSVIPALTLGTKDDEIVAGVGEPTLFNIYKGKVDAVVTDDEGDFVDVVKTSAYTLAPGDELTPIHALIPQSGSGTRSFWIGKVGISEAEITDNSIPVEDTYGAGLKVQEHDGSALVGDAGAIVPFSIGQWVAQSNAADLGVVDRRHDAVLGELNGDAPTVTAGGKFELNPEFDAITRKVYNIVSSSAADNKNSQVNWAFVGKGSLVCSQKDVIKAYGFGVLTAASGANSCGDTSVRAFAPSISSVALASSSTVKFGASVTATATITSNNNGGGTVKFLNGSSTLSTVKVAAGSNKASVTVKPSSLSGYSLKAEFTPNLSGVAEADSTVVKVAVKAASSSVKATAASVKAKVAPKVVVTVTAAGTTPTGTVTIKEGSKTLKAKVAITNGKATVTLPKLKKGTHKLVVTYNGSATVEASKSSTISLKIKK